MSQDREALILDYIRTQDSIIRDRLVELFRPLVESIARRLSFDQEDFDDVVQVGMLGFLRALDRFDPTVQVDFSTFAAPNIMGEIRHYFRDKKNLLKIPRRLQEVRTLIRQYLLEGYRNGKTPTVAQMAQDLQLDEEVILNAMEATQSQSMISLDTPHYSSDDGRGAGASGSLMDTIGGQPCEDTYLDKEALTYALTKLTDRERQIVEMRYFKGFSQQQIATFLGFSQMHISRLLTDIMKKLKKILMSDRG